MSEVTVSDLDNICKELKELRLEKERIQELESEVNQKISRLEASATNHLRDLSRTEYASPHGNIRIVQKWSVALPETDQDKVEFFGWLRERQIFERYATVNSRSLQSLFKAEWEEAKAKAPETALTFTLPGLKAPKIFETTEFRIKK